MKRVCKHILVSGLVQGVGFRYFALRHAHTLGLAGYVRNTRDGRVEIAAEGDQESVVSFIKRMKEGPSSALVREVKVSDYTGPSDFRGFELRF
jgi:acylphosphatase